MVTVTSSSQRSFKPATKSSGRGVNKVVMTRFISLFPFFASQLRDARGHHVCLRKSQTLTGISFWGSPGDMQDKSRRVEGF